MPEREREHGSERRRRERAEKEEKQEEKEEKEEKGRDEKWRRDPVEAAVWAFVLIWIGIVWLLSNVGTLENIFGEKAEWWAVGFLGAGLIFRHSVSRASRPLWMLSTVWSAW